MAQLFIRREKTLQFWQEILHWRHNLTLSSLEISTEHSTHLMWNSNIVIYCDIRKDRQQKMPYLSSSWGLLFWILKDSSYLLYNLLPINGCKLNQIEILILHIPIKTERSYRLLWVVWTDLTSVSLIKMEFYLYAKFIVCHI